MKGKIVIEVDEVRDENGDVIASRIEGHNDLKHVSGFNKYEIVASLMKSLHIDTAELLFALPMIDEMIKNMQGMVVDMGSISKMKGSGEN